MHSTILKRTLIIAIFLSTLWGGNSYSQFYNGMHMTFGKNRIQYQDFNWMYFRSDRCDIYFYPRSKQLAQYVLKYGSSEIEKMEQKIGSTLENKIQFIIYTTFQDFKESNIGLMGEDLYNTGGVNYISGNKVFLYFDETFQDFDKMMTQGIAMVVLSDMIYGGSVFSQLKNQTLLTIPDWFLPGLLSYYTQDWSFDIDNKFRYMILNDKAKNITKLKGEEQAIAAHAFWKFIVDKYSERTLASILNMTRNIRSFEKALLYSLSAHFEDLYADCLKHYRVKYDADLDRAEPTDSELIKIRKETHYSQYVVSPISGDVAYVTNKEGQEKIWLKRSGKKRAKRIYKRNHKIEESPDYSYPLLSWHPRARILGMIIREKELIYYLSYEIENGDKTKRLIANIDKITSFSYSNDGRQFVFSGVKNGQSDIFIYNLASNAVLQITNDIYDDFSPIFFDNNSKIIFSSNRNINNIDVKEIPSRDIIKGKLNLFSYDYENRDNNLIKLTDNQHSNQILPIEIENKKFAYLSDESGINNRYIAKIDSAITHIDTTVHYRHFAASTPQTNYMYGINYHSFSKRDNTIIDLFRNNKRELISQSRIGRISEKSEAIKPSSYRDDLSKSIEALMDTLAEEAERPKRKQLGFVRFRDVYKQMPDYLEKTGDQGYIKIGEDSVLVKDAPEEDGFQRQAERPYSVQYSISQIVSQLDFSYLNTNYQQFSGAYMPIFQNAGFNALFMVGTNDLFEDYRITAGFRFGLDLNDTEFMLSYENLKKRADRQIVFYRQNARNMYDYFATKQNSNTLALVYKWPFSEVSAIRGTVLGRVDKEIFLSTDISTLQYPNYYGYWGGLKAEYIFDNSKYLSINLLQRSRAKVFAEYYQSVEKETRNMIVLGMDYRYYTKIYKNFIWANRFAASTSFGKSKLIYYMGGVDNWLFPKFNQDVDIDRSQNYAYQTLATNMRGFTQNIRNGNSFAVLNSELRFPLFQMFEKRTIKSSFLKNFQIIGFGDIGTAWTGFNPYSLDNSLFTQIIERGPIRVTLEKQTDPIVGGYGFGLRTTIFGYFIRADWAWGVEDRKVQNRVFYISLNLDF